MIKIKLGGIYIITHEPSGKYYIGMSVDIFSRWSSHYTAIKQATHSSPDFAKLFLHTNISEWSFRVIESHSFTKYKNDNKLKGKTAETSFRRFLLLREKEVMRSYSKNFSLNKDNKNFS